MDDDRDKKYLATFVKQVEDNYRVQKNDYIEFALFTNGGELLIDPNAELGRQLSKAGVTAGGPTGSPTTVGNKPKYLVSSNGDALLPMVGVLKIEGLTLRQLDSLLAAKYDDFYKGCFVSSRIENRRCLLFSSGSGGAGGGAGGGLGGGGVFSTPQLSGKVIKLENEKMSLLEVMAQGGQIGVYSKMDRVRIIRGDLTNPQVIVVDLRHLYSITKQDLTILPNDIIYIEPGRRPSFEVIRDVVQVASFFTSSIAVVYVLLQASKR